MGGKQINNFFFFLGFNNRISYTSVNQSLWIDLGLTDILLFAIVCIWFQIIIKPTMHNYEICYESNCVCSKSLMALSLLSPQILFL